MNTKKLIATLLLATFLLFLLPSPAFAAAYGGTEEWNPTSILIGYDGKHIQSAELAQAQDAPTRGIVPIGGKLYSTGKGYIMAVSATGAVSVDVVTLAGADFASPTGTTTGLGAKVINNGVKSGGIWYAQAGDASGNAGVYIVAGSATIGNITATDYAATSGTTTGKGAKMLQVGGVNAGVPYVFSTDANGRLNANIVDSLPSGTNNIGDVDVLTLAGVEYSGTIGSTTGPTKGAVVLGIDSGGIYRVPTTDTAGDLQVDVKGSLPAGSATIGDVTISAVPFDVTDGSSTAPGSSVSVAYFDGTNFQYPSSDANGRANVNIVDALPSGTNTIGTVTITGEDFGVSDGSSTAPGKLVAIAGYTGTVYEQILVSATGQPNVTLPDYDGTLGTSTGAPTLGIQTVVKDSADALHAPRSDTEGNAISVPYPHADALSAVVNITTTDQTQVIAAPAGTLRIISVVISSVGVNDITIKDGSTTKQRAYVAAYGSVVFPAELGFDCTAATALNAQGTAQPYTVTVKYESLP